jgi:hypothetical protein
MLIFSEKNIVYQWFNIFISLLSIISSYFYLYIAAFREIEDNHRAEWHTMSYTSDVFESMFFVYMVLQFFKEYVPEGCGDLVKPER